MTKMTIAQALRRIKKLKGQIAEHTQRAQQNVSYEKDKVPAFRFRGEIAARTLAQDELLDLQARVAVANAKSTVVENGRSLTHAEAVRVLQELKGEIVFLKGLSLRDEVVKSRDQDYDEVKGTYVSRMVETTWVSDYSELERDRQVRALQDRFEELNNTVENHNHKIIV